jgi:hypothetical protein
MTIPAQHSLDNLYEVAKHALAFGSNVVDGPQSGMIGVLDVISARKARCSCFESFVLPLISFPKLSCFGKGFLHSPDKLEKLLEERPERLASQLYAESLADSRHNDGSQ